MTCLSGQDSISYIKLSLTRRASESYPHLSIQVSQYIVHKSCRRQDTVVIEALPQTKWLSISEKRMKDSTQPQPIRAKLYTSRASTAAGKA